jgi:hypothetical protein
MDVEADLRFPRSNLVYQNSFFVTAGWKMACDWRDVIIKVWHLRRWKEVGRLMLHEGSTHPSIYPP